MLVLLFSSGVIFLYRFTAGEFLFQKTIHAIEQENNGTKAYNTAILALRQNPAHTKIHQTFSQINLLLAQSVIAAAREKQQSAVLTLSDEDKNLVTTLMTQSVREAKTATALSPSNVYAWGNLANIYQNLIGTAIEADQWAVAAYQKAISLDPTNPVLHLDLGGVYTTLKNTDSATREYVTAVSLKPNYTNGYYNLANVYKLKGDTASARKALDQVLLLLPKDSPSYHQVTEELKNLNAPTPEQNNESTRSPELTKPQIPTRPLIVPELTFP